ncbi:serine-rich adhesin for platelets-like isoform X3 [Oryzias latipes]|uniref:serine-rich adhesin for platelets-like isoform X3 n=1 Tax=Oryzias latipes TaxID=8090 RepID=UPI000CE1EB3E|nr:serine-rich adhesin for platelets-like isoform X3 [Oryzias latipes]
MKATYLFPLKEGMAKTKSNLTFVLLLMLLVVETQNFSELSVQVSQQDHDEPGLPNRRVKREVQDDKAEYEVDVEVNLTDSRTLENLRNFLRTGQFILTLGPSVNITQIVLTTVCYINGTNIECRCEDQYAWPSSSCFSYGACGEITDSTCGCINKVPLDGSFCQPKSVSVYQYRLDIQINMEDAEQLRSNFANLTFPRQISSDVNISDADVTTVCSPAESNIQCRCERNFLWLCDKCATYGKCDEGSTCGCIKAVPTDGQFCQSELNNPTVCPSTTLVPSLTSSSTAVTEFFTATPFVTTTLTDSPPVTTKISTTAPDVTSTMTDSPPGSTEIFTTMSSVTTLMKDSPSVTTEIVTTMPDVTTTMTDSPPVTTDIFSTAAAETKTKTEFSSAATKIFTTTPDVTTAGTGSSSVPTEFIPTSLHLTTTMTDSPPVTTEIVTTVPDVTSTMTDSPPFTTEIFITTPGVTTSMTVPPPVYKYLLSVELNTTLLTAINTMRSILGNISYPLSINGDTQINQANISTVCSPIRDGYQCICEDQYRWSCDQCLMYGACDQISADSCGCINAIPSDRNFCQSLDQHNSTDCSSTISTTVSTCSSSVPTEFIPTSLHSTTTMTDSPSVTTEIVTTVPDVTSTMTDSPPFTTEIFITTPGVTTSMTVPPPVYKYLLSVELNTTLLTAINTMRSILGNISYPLSINGDTQINQANISTVCSPIRDGYQCICEDQYRWSCDQCLMYGACDQISADSCGCINAIPSDRNFCQSLDQHNFTVCPTTTPRTFTTYSPSVTAEKFTTSPDVTTIMTDSPSVTIKIFTTAADVTTTKTDFITTTEDVTTSMTELPPPVYNYRLSVELNTTDITVIDKLRSILGNLTDLPSLNRRTRISRANITTVCSPVSYGYQCRCEDQYLWSCDQCQTYGSCDQVSEKPCGCINAIPPDGHFCQSLDQLNLTACQDNPTTPPATATAWTMQSFRTTGANGLTSVNTTETTKSWTTPIMSPTPTTRFSTVIPTTLGEPLSANSTVTSTTIKETTTVISTGFPTTQTVAISTDIPSNTEEPTTSISTVITATTKEITNAGSTVIPTTTKTKTPSVTMVSPIPSEATTNALSTVIPTTTEEPITAIIPTTTGETTTETFTVISTPTETQMPAVTTVISATTEATSNAISTVIHTITKEPTTAFLTSITTTTKETTTPASTVISTAETQMSPITIFSPTTIGATTREVSTGFFTTTDEPTTATSTLMATTTGPITTANPTVIPTTSEKPTTKVVTVIPTTIKEPTTAISTLLTSDKVPTTALIPTTTTTTATTTTSTVPTTTTKPMNNTTETIATTTTATATTSTTTKATTTTTKGTTTTTTKATTTTTTEAITTATITTIKLTTSTPSFTAIDIAVSVTFDMVFRNEFHDKTSSAYQSLEKNITTELKKQYSSINGFVGVTVTGFRQGSVIADFVISTAESSATQITEANKDLKNTLKSIAPVLKSTAQYKSSTKIKFNSTYLTNTTMTLVCGPPEGDLLDIVGNINSAEWKFENINISPGRRTFTTRSNTSILTVNNVNPFDAGLYECILKGTNFEFYQNGTVEKVNIQAAPDVKVVVVKNTVCNVGNKANLSCCVQPIYNITWAQPPSSVQISRTTSSPDEYCINNEYTITSCEDISKPLTFTCKVNEYDGYEKTTTLKFFTGAPTCTGDIYGDGKEGSIADVACPEGQKGKKKAICKGNKWELIEDNCILTVITDLFAKSTELVQENVQTFSSDLQKAVNDSKTEIAKSSKSVSTIVDILTTIANVSTSVTTDVMRNVLQTIDVLADDGVKESWETLNKDRNNNAGSKLLESLETLSGSLSGTADISTERIHLIRTNANNFVTPNSTVSLKISDSDGFFDNNTLMTIIILSTFNNVMPARNSSFDLSLFNGTSNETSNPNNANLAINAAVVLVKVNQTVQNVSFEFQTLNETLSQETQCVFWNFTLLENFGAWDDEGCKFVSRLNDRVTCNCTHLTSFSILMATSIPEDIRDILDIITYIGVGISLASLVICLIIEGYVWKAVTKNSTALMRHISIVNTALSLLIADICFIIAASYSQKALDNKDGDFKVLIGQCSAVTFFMHFFYLSLFFWMLVSGLLLFYRTMMVFSHMSKSIMIAMGFVIGYGCPLIIAVTTVAATAPSQTYIRKNYICWLNWTESKALLSLVIPALVIVVINIIVVIVVLYKMMRRSSASTIQPDEKNSFVVILRCLAILTPLFGLTWALGIGTMVSPKDVGIHIAFAFFNSLQGFFILVFGTLFDSKIRAVLSSRTPSINSISTTSTSGGTSSFGGLVTRLRGRRNVYQVSQPRSNGNNSGSSESYSMI